jgi:hypothetical protein
MSNSLADNRAIRIDFDHILLLNEASTMYDVCAPFLHSAIKGR